MISMSQTVMSRAGRMCRTCAVTLIAGCRRSLTVAEVNARISALPLRDQVVITGAVLSALFLMSFFAAQFGWIGLLAFWLAVIVIVN